MTTFLLVDDALRSPELRHELGEAQPDPLVFIERDGHRIVVGSHLEQDVFEKREDVIDEFWTFSRLGGEDLIRDEDFPFTMFMPEMASRALERLAVKEVRVPGTLSVTVADHLRGRGIEVVVDDEGWALRRRRKTPSELEGMERAQRAADMAMVTAARMLREAEPTGMGQLRFEGEILTAEWIREVMASELLTQGAESEDILVQSGEASLKGHDPGSGPVIPDAPVIIDCFPVERRSGVYTDMTRTFVPGTPSDEISKLHAHCKTALEMAFDAIRPGAADVHARVTEYFHSQGFPTQLHHSGSEPLKEGFHHSLGHGVGLEVHERPYVGRRAEPLSEGDVIAVEPGLYFPGVGGVRIEDTVLVTSNGPQHLTDPLPYDLEP